MRRLISKSVALFLLSVVIAVWCSTGYAISEEISIQPLYDLTYATKATISITDDGIAQCSGYIRAMNATDSVSITIALYRKVGNSWSFVESWSENDQLYYASVSGTHRVSSGTYKVQLSGTVVAPDGTTETVSGSSAEKTYD